MVSRRERQGDARAHEAAVGQVVVSSIASAVCQRDGGRDRERVNAVDRPCVAAAVGHGAQSRGVPTVVPLRRVREADVVPVAGRRTCRVRAGDDPRGDVALRERAADRPVGRAPCRRAE